MKISIQARSLVTAVALSMIGCDPSEPKTEGPPKAEEHSESKLGPPSPEPPVVPSTVPAMPEPTKPGMTKDEPKPEMPK